MVLNSPSVVSKITDLYGHGTSSKAATSNSATAAAAASAAGGKAAAEGTNSDDKTGQGLSRRAGAAQERRMSRRRDSSSRLNVKLFVAEQNKALESLSIGSKDSDAPLLNKSTILFFRGSYGKPRQ